jgi:hypothetical protein
MSGHVDLDSLKQNVYFVTATLDDRYTWALIPRDELANLGITDEADRYRITGCAHREADRIAGSNRCGHCGGENYYEPPAAEAARKKRGRK